MHWKNVKLMKLSSTFCLNWKDFHLYHSFPDSCPVQCLRVKARNPFWRGRLSTVDLLILTSIEQLFLLLQRLFTFLRKQATLLRRSTVLSLSLQQGFLALTLKRWNTFQRLKYFTNLTEQCPYQRYIMSFPFRKVTIVDSPSIRVPWSKTKSWTKPCGHEGKSSSL